MARLRRVMTDRDEQRADDHAGGQGLVEIFGLRQGQEHNYPRARRCGRHGFWPAMRASADRQQVTNVSPVWLKAPCASFVKRKSSRTRSSRTPRRRVRAQDGGSSVCLPRGPGPEKAAAKAEKSKKPVAIVSYDEKPGIRPSPRRHRICRQCQAAMRASRGIMSTNAMARSAC